VKGVIEMDCTHKEIRFMDSSTIECKKCGIEWCDNHTGSFTMKNIELHNNKKRSD